jgi:hypothetical protein
MEAPGTAAGLDDGAAIVSATIAVCERDPRGRAYSRCLCGLRGNGKLVASRAAALLAGFPSWVLDEVSRREKPWSNRSGARLPLPPINDPQLVHATTFDFSPRVETPCRIQINSLR